MKAISFVCFVIVLASTPLLGLSQNVGEWEPAKILELPTATVPYAVKKSGLGGNVRVRVKVDDKGNVTDVVDATGPDGVCPQVDAPDVVALRAAAKQSVLSAKFSPATSGGKSIASFAWLDFDFPRPDLKKESVVSNADGTVEKYPISPGTSDNVKTCSRRPDGEGDGATHSEAALSKRAACSSCRGIRFSPRHNRRTRKHLLCQRGFRPSSFAVGGGRSGL